jgi:hypothetical protein
MSTVAEQLRQGREAKSLTVQQVADITKIRTDHLRSLEEGDFNTFSAPVYIRGFVRTYASLLKLDVPGVMATLDAELRQTSKFAEPPSLSGPPSSFLDTVMLFLSKVDWQKGVVALGVILLLVGSVSAYALWRHYQKADPLAGLKPGIYRPTNAPGETLPLPARAPAPAPRR